MIRALRLATAAAVAIAVGTTTACAPPAETAPDELTIAIPYFGEPDANAPAANLLTIGPMQAAYESLTYWNPVTDTIDPMLAEEITFSDDKMTMTLKLREDVDFTDGVHMTAEGVVEYLEYAYNADETIAAYWLTSIAPVPEMEVLDEYTIEFRAASTLPFSYDYMTSFSCVPIMSPDSIPVEGEESEGYPAGTGPYLFDELEQDVSVTMTRNPDYWNPDAYPFDTITFQTLADPVASLNALKSGQVDVTPIELSYAEEAAAAGFTINESSTASSVLTLVILDRDGSMQPALADRRVREAMILAIDREGIRDNLAFGYGTVSSQPFVDYQPFYIEGADDDYPYDPERARELMAEAGYADGFSITIPSYPGWPTTEYEPIIQQSLLDIGITVTFEPLADGLAYKEAIIAGSYALAAPAAPAVNLVKSFQYGTWGPDADEELLDLIDVFYHGTTAESEQAAQDIGHFLIDKIWFMPVAKPKALWASIPDVVVEVGGTVGYPYLSGIKPAGQG